MVCLGSRTLAGLGFAVTGCWIGTSHISSISPSLTSFSTIIEFDYGPFQAMVVSLGSRTLAGLGFAVTGDDVV